MLDSSEIKRSPGIYACANDFDVAGLSLKQVRERVSEFACMPLEGFDNP